MRYITGTLYTVQEKHSCTARPIAEDTCAQASEVCDVLIVQVVAVAGDISRRVLANVSSFVTESVPNAFAFSCIKNMEELRLWEL